jgi:phosphoglycolate phosphatase
VLNSSLPKTCLFDLDGTLSDPKPGITGCIQYGLEKLGQAVPSQDELEWCIGPPLHDSFLQLCGGDSQMAAKGLEYYRERFGTIGMYENKLYDNIPETLERFSEAGIQLFVCTSKPHYYAGPITEHFGIRHFFQHVHGSEMTGERVNKGKLIEYIIREEGIDPSTTIMIGDRKHDIFGAKQHAIHTVGVLYGYGSKEELTEAGADTLVTSPQEIADTVLS